MPRIIFSLSIISGTVIGAGLFALPYLTLKVGVGVILVYFVALGTIAILIHSFFGELALKTKDFIRLPGFAKHYLGEWGYRTALVSGILGMFGACLVYLVIGGKFLSLLASPLFNAGESFYTVVYFFFGALLIYLGIKAVGKVQFWGLVLFFLTLFGIFLRGRSYLDFSNFSVSEIDRNYLFAPYGVILFSLWGLSLIPEAEENLGDQRKSLRKIIPVAIIIPIIVYLVFIFLVLGITGENTTQAALDGLQDSLGGKAVSLILVFGILTTFTSFVALGLTLKKIFWYDLGISEKVSWMITCFIPLSLFLFGFNDFIKILALVGGTMLAVDGILVSLMYRKIASPGKRFLIYPVIIALFLGLVYELIYSF
jgi:tyrosine-specific transport protein